MCGIFGYIGGDGAVMTVVEGLHKLEYRGYDSAGVAVIGDDGKLKVVKKVGYVSDLARLVFARSNKLQGKIAIGHTRCATHGGVNQVNAHPHVDCNRRIAVVHNGVIENFDHLKKSLIKKGHKFRSQTDTEVIAHLIEDYVKAGLEFKEAFKKALQRLVGTWAVAVVSVDTPDQIWVGRMSSPLAVGMGKGEVYVASDAGAFSKRVKQVIFLEDGQLAKLSVGGKQVEVFDLNGQAVDYKLINKGELDEVRLDKGGFAHFMLKEIHEQPLVVERALKGRVDFKNKKVVLGGLAEVRDEVKSKEFVGIMACGTSLFAGMIGRLFGVGAMGLSVWEEDSSDFGRFNINRLVMDKSAVLYVSQSGETADTLEALRLIQKRTRALNLGIVNVVGSSLARMVKAGVYTRAGVEVGVASTKNFTAQVIALMLVMMYVAQLKGGKENEIKKVIKGFKGLPDLVGKVLGLEKEIKKVARKMVKVKNFMFLGRWLAYPVALEGALKLKEITYRFSYGDKLGSLKHGPLAVVDKDNMVVAIVFKDDPDVEKSISNVYEVVARKGRVVVITDIDKSKFPKEVEAVIKLPNSLVWIMPVLSGVVVQLLAYYLALYLGREIDKPRYLAKSVTVI